MLRVVVVVVGGCGDGDGGGGGCGGGGGGGGDGDSDGGADDVGLLCVCGRLCTLVIPFTIVCFLHDGHDDKDKKKPERNINFMKVIRAFIEAGIEVNYPDNVCSQLHR